MRISIHRRLDTGTLVAALLISAAADADGGRLTVDVVDRDGRAVPEVAVYAIPHDAAGTRTASEMRPSAIVDQRNRAFVPHVLIASTGTQIEFPNSDAVSHHVYSFSPAKTFELPLYKRGTVHAPLAFDTPGVVTLGCNIHDDMVGYILLVDSPYFSMTGGDGTAVIDRLPPGRYALHVWTPRMRASYLPGRWN
jgi:plastocyanin